MNKIYIAIPNQGWIRQELANWVHHWQHTYDCIIDFPTEVPIDQNRNAIVKEFLKTDAEYLLMVDADNPPTIDVVPLRAHDLDVVGFPTPVIHALKPDTLLWNVYQEYGEKYIAASSRGKGIQRVDVVGTGCIMIARKVLEKLKAPFNRELNEDGTNKHGEDAAFCRKAKREGFKVWVAWDYPCNHYKEINLVRL